MVTQCLKSVKMLLFPSATCREFVQLKCQRLNVRRTALQTAGPKYTPDRRMDVILKLNAGGLYNYGGGYRGR